MFLNRRSERTCFVRFVEFNKTLEFDFNLVLRSMRILFGQDCIVVFKVID